MTTPVRISAEEVREKTRSGAALLVCAYEENEKFTSMQLEGAISWLEFQSRLPNLSKDQEVIFYCA